jgi:Na+/H+-translocating membrane pyrophosphatase
VKADERKDGVIFVIVPVEYSIKLGEKVIGEGGMGAINNTFNHEYGNLVLGGYLAGATLSGVVLALTMVNAGGAWDNAKKYIEAGHFGGKGSDSHKAAVVGDTVGDPLKDTSGPSLNILIKLTSLISLLLATL